MPDRNVMLAFPHGGTVRTEFMLSVVGFFQQPDHQVRSWQAVHGGPVLGMNRNIMARNFMATDLEWLWMIDTDVDFANDTLPQLMEAADPVDRPVVGASCLLVGDDFKPVTNLYSIELGKPGEHLIAEPDTLMRVDGTGCGCLLVHRSVFETLGSFPFLEVVTAACEYSEDLSFCLRCREAKIPVYVHTGVKVGHTKALRLLP